MDKTNRIPCTLCNRMILPITAERNSGICGLCHNYAEDEKHRDKEKITGDCLFSVPALLTGERNRDAIRFIYILGAAYAAAFTETCITSVNLLSRFESYPDGFHIYLKDFKEEYKSFIPEVFNKFYVNLSRCKIDGIPSEEKVKISILGTIENCKKKLLKKNEAGEKPY